MDFINIAQNAKTASLEIADISTKIKNQALLEIAQAIENNAELIYSANKKDLEESLKLCRKIGVNVRGVYAEKDSGKGKTEYEKII